ncbi:thioredoxin domain-containing protein [Pedobacter sp. SYSU D00535]|uniref:thioredoxin domain-containing protein n=1 Tax=Pedobacter sp. SYSU D00535 TaxID=2810308 RepID=UPI001A969F45|nr:thioredoxin domain-containing protein [Pedobacter sp. SYSU D00535]
MANRLSKESSPYLLQHAENPVDWYPWGAEALRRARDENKLIIVSIGYAACHWCHVMEQESFEDQEVAAIMNQHFICIKVDREERPDIDQIYIMAAQLMTGRGGWPLNCICLPDQRPLYAGTYYRKEEWKKLLVNLAEFWQSKSEQALEYAERLTAGISEAEQLDLSQEASSYSRDDLKAVFEPWKQYFDFKEGGYSRSPKFPMPNNWRFLLQYGALAADDTALSICKLTLEKLAQGGIYDHLGGGFARYSVDEKWHVPHFEKMLYDNGQLLSLFSEGFQYFRDERFKTVVYETVKWLEREMTSPEGGFYSALDADSEGVEGKFYTFSYTELVELLGNAAEAFCKFYSCTPEGNWQEEGTNVLMIASSASAIAGELGIEEKDLVEKIEKARQQLFQNRETRVRPARDTKILASWNGMALKGLCDAYKAFADPAFLNLALQNGRFIRQSLLRNGRLHRVFRAQAEVPSFEDAFLDDYAFVIDAFIALYEVTFDEEWLNEAMRLSEYVLQQFYDAGTGLLYYTSQSAEELIVRKHELLDNVIPSSNSQMAINLYKLGHFFDNEAYLDQAREMLSCVFTSIKTYGSAYSNWCTLLLYEVFGLLEVAITGAETEALRTELEKYFVPNKITLGGSPGTLPLLQDKWTDKTTIYVCKNRTCGLPVHTVADALLQLK